jgi:hypothetical protein
MESLKEHTQAKAICARFIDEYRLFGTVGLGPETALWDSTSTLNPQVQPGLVFELGPDYSLKSNHDWDAHDHEMNHALPFRESPSMGITGFTVFTKHSTTAKQLLIFQVRDIVSFAHRIGTIPYVPWQDWLHFATPIELPLTFPHTRILHSQVLDVCRASVSSADPRPILRIWDFSFRSRRQQVQDDPSAPLPPYTTREFPLDVGYRWSKIHMTEGGVLFTRVRIHAIARHAKVLIRCTFRIQLARNETSGHRRESGAITTRSQAFSYIFKQSTLRFVPPPPHGVVHPSAIAILCAPPATPSLGPSCRIVEGAILRFPGASNGDVESCKGF